MGRGAAPPAVPLAGAWHSPGLTLLSLFCALTPWIMTANYILIAFLILFSFRGLFQKSALLLLHWSNSPMNSEPQIMKSQTIQEKAWEPEEVFWLPQQRAFGPAVNPFNNFSSLHLLM